MPLDPSNRMDPAEAQRLKAGKRLAAESWQKEQTTIVGQTVVCPAIGKTGGVDNVGWEVRTPGRPDRFYATKELALECAKKDANG